MTLGLVLLSACASRTPAPESSALSVTGPGAVDAPVVLSVEPWTYAGATGDVIRTAHYRIYTTERDPLLRGRLPDFLEQALQHYRTSITPLPEPRMRLDTYLMDNRSQWQAITRQLTGQQSPDYLRIQRGGFAMRGVGVFFDLGLYDTLAIAAHEGWHQYTQRAFRDPMPVWLDEGLASFMEGHRWYGSDVIFRPWANLERFDQLRADAAGGTLLTLEELLATAPTEQLTIANGSPLTYYAQVWALIHFLNEGDGGVHRAALVEMLEDAASGRMRRRVTIAHGQSAASPSVMRRTDVVFRTYLGDDLTVISKEYEAFVQRITTPGTRGAVVQGRSPLTTSERP
jgi:hypothetical protein